MILNWLYRLIGSLEKHWRWFGWRGLLIYFRSRYLGDHSEVVVYPPQLKEPVTLRLGTADIFFYGAIISEGAYYLPLKNPPRIIVDAGANIGLTSIYFANRYPEARIFSLEPDESNFAMLTRNTAGYPHITPIHRALWNTCTDLEVYNPFNSFGGIVTWTPDSTKHIPSLSRVTTTTIPELMKEYKIESIDVLKVDIEGSEKEVFQDSSEWIGHVGIIVTELHDRIKRGCSLSFYNATQGFDLEWHQGEQVVTAQGDLIQKESIKAAG